MTSALTTNRPFKFGSKDRREFIVQDSEVALRAINDTSGNPIFLARALVGTAESEQKWQIRKIQYDSNGGAISVTWPVNSLSAASTNYEFVWKDTATAVVTDITQANPGVATTSSAHGFSDGDIVLFQGVAGMTEVNFDGSNLYTVANSTATTFELSGIDTSAFTAYSSGGTVTNANAINYTYS